MTLTVPRLPEGEGIPSNEEMADLIVRSLPEDDRAEARSLLAEKVFPALVGDSEGHPNPRAVAELVYDDLADALEGAPEEARLSVVRSEALRAEIGELFSQSLALAIARYLHDNPAAREAAGDVGSHAQRWLAAPVEQIEADAARRQKALEDWRERAQRDYPWLWETNRVKYLHTQLNLESAQSGSFQAAAGSLYDFLTRLGVPVQSFDVG